MGAKSNRIKKLVKVLIDILKWDDNQRRAEAVGLPDEIRSELERVLNIGYVHKQPFKVGDRVMIVKTAYEGTVGTIARINLPTIWVNIGNQMQIHVYPDFIEKVNFSVAVNDHVRIKSGALTGRLGVIEKILPPRSFEIRTKMYGVDKYSIDEIDIIRYSPGEQVQVGDRIGVVSTVELPFVEVMFNNQTPEWIHIDFVEKVDS